MLKNVKLLEKWKIGWKMKNFVENVKMVKKYKIGWKNENFVKKCWKM